jgi:hypothetical protein
MMWGMDFGGGGEIKFHRLFSWTINESASKIVGQRVTK